MVLDAYRHCAIPSFFSPDGSIAQALADIGLFFDMPFDVALEAVVRVDDFSLANAHRSRETSLQFGGSEANLDMGRISWTMEF